MCPLANTVRWPSGSNVEETCSSKSDTCLTLSRSPSSERPAGFSANGPLNCSDSCPRTSVGLPDAFTLQLICRLIRRVLRVDGAVTWLLLLELLSGLARG